VGHEAFGGQGAAQGGPYRPLVVDDQDARPGYRPWWRAQLARHVLVGHGAATAPARAAQPWNTMPTLILRIPDRQVQKSDDPERFWAGSRSPPSSFPAR